MTPPWDGRASTDLDDLVARARQVARQELAPRSAEVDATGAFPVESVASVVEAGLHAVCVPRRWGGPGGDLTASVVVAEELARGCMTTQQVVGGNELFALPLLLAGAEDLQARYLPRIASGEVLGAFALSEPEAGSDVAAMTTRATRVEDGWHLKGVKRWITNAGRAGAYVVFAVTDREAGSRGISAFVLEPEDGFTVGAPERKMGLRGSTTAELVLDTVVPADRLVGQEGQGLRLALATLDRTRAVVASQAVGVAQAALDCVLAQVRARRHADPPGTDHQGEDFVLADLATSVRAARLLARAAAEEAEACGPDTGLLGAMAKCRASDTAVEVTTRVLDLLGPQGCTSALPAERYLRDAKITQIYEGTNQIQRVVVARSLLRGPVPRREPHATPARSAADDGVQESRV